MKVVVIGGGPAGMLAAIASAKQGNKVTILEKMNSLGKKLCITGKGRCNITSSLPMEDFIKNIPGNGRFLYSAFQNFTNEDIINLLDEEGLKCKEERGNRVFPVTDKAVDVLNALLNKLKSLDVEIVTNANAQKILTEGIISQGDSLDYLIQANNKGMTEDKIDNCECKENNKEIKVKGVIANNKMYEANKIILATGGMSYPTTGSTRRWI